MIKFMDHSVHNTLVFKVINHLIDEIKTELLKGNTISIGNFGKLELKKSKKRNYFNVIDQKVKSSNGNRKLSFKLSRKLKKIIKDSK